jgi:hypothetical protein
MALERARLLPISSDTVEQEACHVINLASRMQSVAPPNGVVVSEETRRLVEGYFELYGLGPTEVKGVAGTINVFEVIATGRRAATSMSQPSAASPRSSAASASLSSCSARSNRQMPGTGRSSR